MKWVNVDEYKYLIVGDIFCKTVVWDEYDDGDFECEAIDGSYRILVSKNDTGLFVANAMDGWGNNCRDKFQKDRVLLLSPISDDTPAPDVQGLVEALRTILELNAQFKGNSINQQTQNLAANALKQYKNQ